MEPTDADSDTSLNIPSRRSFVTAFGVLFAGGASGERASALSRLLRMLPTTAQARIQVTPTLRLGPKTERLTWWPRVVVANDAHLFMISAAAELPFRVDATGGDERLVGTAGEGPGEFRLPSALALDAMGRLHAFDAQLGRRQVFDSELRLVSSTSVGPYVVSQALVLPNGYSVLCMRTLRQDILEPTLYLLSADGRTRAAVRAEIVDNDRLGERWRASLVVGPSSDGGFWAGHKYRTVMERFDARGRHLGTVPYASARFVQPRLSPQQQDVAVLGESALGSTLVGLWEDSRDVVILTYLVPTGVRFEKDSRWKIFRTVVEVVDARRGRTLGATEIPDEAISVARPRAIAAYSESESGEPQVTLYDIALTLR